jgi:hypothetical protein
MFHSSLRSAFSIITLLGLVAFAPRSAFGQSAPTLTVDAAGNPHPINPDIYGIASYGLDSGFAKEIQVPNVRWGGDATTRYNWEVDSSNAGFDWYFMGGNGQATPVPSASADMMVNTYKAASNAHALLTIPIIPYVNKTAAWNCSFPVSVYGPQQSTNPYVHPNGDNCGNSLTTTGAQLTDNNIYANHIDNTVALQQGWVQHFIATFGTAANGGVPYYQLDNEPGGWSNTHRDVEPTQSDYDTIITLGQQYARMVKQTDSSAKVFGPVDFTLGGWIGTPSKQNNLYAGQYYLQKMATYDQTNHQRVLDYFDEHYYGGGSTDASELASTRALWDPTFNSGSWVEQYYFDGPMMLLPRFENWIQTYYPGTKLSISEYSFSSGTNPLVDALTEADVLGIYGREGLDFANLWSVPKPTDAVAYSFRLYRNYDGAGGQFGDSSVTSTSTDQGQLSVYGAMRSSDGALTVIVINKTTSPIQTSLALANFSSTGAARVYTYSSANMTQIVAGAAVPVVSNTVNYNFAVYSATVFVFTTAAVSTASTTTSLAATSSQIAMGQSVAFTATVAPAWGTGTPTGTVTFKDSGIQIGTGTLNTSGSATFSTSGLAVGAHSVTAVYSGDANFSSSSSAAVSVTVSAPVKTATSTSLSASATQLTSGQSVTFTASIAPQSGSGTPTGSAAFLDGQTQIGTSPLGAGSSTFTSSSLSAGSHSITATYSGDATYAGSTSAPVSITVGTTPAPDYSLSISNSSLTVGQGSSGSLTITATPKNGFKQSLALACSGLPAGGSCSFNPQSINPGSGAVSTTLTVQAPAIAGSAILLNEPFSGSCNAALCILAMLLVGIVGASGNKRSVRGNVRLLQTILASTIFAVLLVTAGCAGLSSPQNQAQATPYVVTVTASAANAPAHALQFTFYVRP